MKLADELRQLKPNGAEKTEFMPSKKLLDHMKAAALSNETAVLVHIPTKRVIPFMNWAKDEKLKYVEVLYNGTNQTRKFVLSWEQTK